MSPARPLRPTRPPRAGVTAFESLLSVAIVTIVGSALISSLSSAVRSSSEIALTTVASGLADQLLCEAVTLPVPSGTATSAPAGPRSGFLVVDHFHGWTESPPQDRFGRLLGTEGILSGGTSIARPAGLQADAAFLTKFGRTVAVEKVTPSAGSWAVTASDTPYRRVVVRVSFTEDGRVRPLAEVSQIVCHAAPAL